MEPTPETIAETTGEADILVRAFAIARDPIDRPAAEALADRMESWDANELATYRAAISREVARLGDQPPRGYLAAEVLALIWAAGETAAATAAA